jgi:hypothetical protein
MGNAEKQTPKMQFGRKFFSQSRNDYSFLLFLYEKTTIAPAFELI